MSYLVPIIAEGVLLALVAYSLVVLVVLVALERWRR